MSGTLRRALPWWGRIGAKLVLSRLPLGGRTWQSLGLFSPGEMMDPDYALRVFDRHFRRGGAPGPGFAFTELGPGDSLASAVIGHAHGAARCWLVDAGAYASDDIGVYRRLIERTGETVPGFDPAPLLAARDRAGLLAACNATYLETGLAGLRAIPEGSCDMVFSQAVLEHVPRPEFAATMGEIRRILKPGGRSTHQIDFRDHLGGGLAHLRFRESLWEAPWFARRSGFYTNRLRPSEMRRAFAEAGFTTEAFEPQRREGPPISHTALDPAFRGCSDEDLAILDAFAVLRVPDDRVPDGG